MPVYVTAWLISKLNKVVQVKQVLIICAVILHMQTRLVIRVQVLNLNPENAIIGATVLCNVWMSECLSVDRDGNLWRDEGLHQRFVHRAFLSDRMVCNERNQSYASAQSAGIKPSRHSVLHGHQGSW